MNTNTLTCTSRDSTKIKASFWLISGFTKFLKISVIQNSYLGDKWGKEEEQGLGLLKQQESVSIVFGMEKERITVHEHNQERDAFKHRVKDSEHNYIGLMV